MSPVFAVWISQMFNGLSCWGKMSYFSVNNEQKMTLITAKNAATEPHSGGKARSRRQSVVMQQQITHCPASFLYFTNPPPTHPKSPAGGLDTKQTQHIPNTQQLNMEDTKKKKKRKKDANTERLDVHGSVCAHQQLVSTNPFSGSSTSGHSFTLQRQRDVNGFINVCFPPTDCCVQPMGMTAAIL